MSGRGRGRNTLVCRGIIICHRGVLWDKVILSQGGDGIHHLSRGVTVAENLSMGVNQGNYYVLGGYGKFFLHRGVFLFTGIAHSLLVHVYTYVYSRAVASTFEVVRLVGMAKLRPPTTPLVAFHLQLQRSYNCINIAQ